MPTATGSDPTHHILLSDGVTSVGFVITDQSGERNERALRRFPFSDPNNPYSTHSQRGWSGGFGVENAEDLADGYWKSKGVDALKSGALTLGPLFQYAKGYRSEDRFLPVSAAEQPIVWRALYGSNRYRAVKFTASAGYTTGKLYFWARARGSPGILTVRLRSDTGGNPGTVADTITLGSPTTTDAQYLVTSGLSGNLLTSGFPYWIEWVGNASNDQENHWEIMANVAITTGKSSSDGTTYNATNEGYAFRLVDADKPFIARFFEYRGQLYSALDYEDTTIGGKLYMNGWRGAADANSGADINKLKDATQTGWDSSLADLVVRMVAGYPTAEDVDYRKVTTGASGALTVSPSWNIAHSTNDDYVVLGSDRWFPVTMSGIFSIKDVAVANGIVYLTTGNTSTIMAHREYNNNGVWTANSTANCWREIRTKASFAKVINDPVTGPVLWLGRNPGERGRSRPEVWKTATDLAWSTAPLSGTALVTFDTIWTAATADVDSSIEAPPEQKQYLRVRIGRVTSVNTTVATGGAGYTVGDILTINQTGSGVNATVRVETLAGGGAVATISLQSGGWDYTTGTGKPTTGGTGSGCQVEITGISSFGTGVIGYINLAATVNIRNNNRIRLRMMGTVDTINSGELELVLDDSTNVASPILSLNVGRLDPGQWKDITIPFDPGATTGADLVASVGLQLTVAHSKTFQIALEGAITAHTDYDPVYVGEEGDNITGLESYGDPETLWVLTETGIGEVSNNKFVKAKQRELQVARHPSNGKAHTVHDVYLIFSWRGKLQRYFRENIENLGPRYPQGLMRLAGSIVDAITYPDRIYVAMDGGNDGTSQVLVIKGDGWHEIYTAPVGERIRKIYIQAIPLKSDRLWISVGSDIGYVPLTLDPTVMEDDSDYKYTYEGSLETSWIHTSREDLEKIFKSVMLYAENVDLPRRRFPRAQDRNRSLTGDGQLIDIQAALDSDLFNYRDVGTMRWGTHTELDLDTGVPPDRNNITGRRMRLKLRLSTSENDKTPILRGVTTKMYIIPEIKFGYSWLTKLSSLTIDLHGDETRALGQFTTVQAALAQLDTWARSLTPLVIRTDLSIAKDKVVVLEPPPGQLLTTVPDEKLEEMLVQIVVNDI